MVKLRHKSNFAELQEGGTFLKLKKLAEISVGVNVTRIKQSEYASSPIYSNDDLMNDLNTVTRINKNKKSYSNIPDNKKFLISEGDILYSFVSSKVAIASKASEGKVLNQNFAKLTLISQDIEPAYLCYFLNESKNVARQMGFLMQGTVLPKLSPAILNKVEIKILPKDRQKKIGDYYFSLKRKMYLSLLELELQKKIHIELLEKMNEQ